MTEAALAAASRPLGRAMFWLFVVGMLVLTVCFLGLGKWQLDRLAWKNGLVAQAAANMRLPPSPLPSPAQWPDLDADTFQYRPVTVAGHYLPAQELRVFVGLSDAVRGQYSGPGYWVMTPFAIDGGGTVLVDRGFVPQDLPPGRSAAAPAGALTIAGVAVASEEAGPFTPAADTAHRIDWARNIDRLKAMLPAADGPVAPVYVDLPAGPRGSLPQGGETTVDFPNNHLGYAFTWFGFALTTIIMLAEWVRRQWERGRAAAG